MKNFFLLVVFFASNLVVNAQITILPSYSPTTNPGEYQISLTAQCAGVLPVSFSIVDANFNAIPTSSAVVNVAIQETYYVYAVDANGCSTVSNFTIVNQNNPSTCHNGFGIATTPNSGTVTFTNTTTANFNGATWYWGDGTTTSDTATTVIHNYGASGVYYPYLVTTYITPNGLICADTSAPGMVTVDTTFCNQGCYAYFGQTSANSANFSFANYSSQGTNTNYLWTFGDGTSSTAANPTHLYTTNGVYNVCLIVTDSSAILNPCSGATAFCSDTFCTTISVNGAGTSPACNSSMTYTSSGCQGVFVNTSAAGYTNATWYFGDGTSASNLNQTVTHTYSNSGVYYPTLVIEYGTPGTPTYCIDSSMLGQLPINCSTAVCNASFVSTVLPNSTIAGFSSTSTMGANSNFLYWSFGDGTTGFGTNPTHTYANSGTYNVCLYIIDSLTQNICDSSCQTITTAGAPCTAAFTTNQINGSTINFNNQSTPATANTQFFWNFGDGTTSMALSPQHIYSVTGVYTVCLIMNTSNSTGSFCSDTFCTSVSVQASAPACNATMTYTSNGCQGIFVNTSASGYTNATWYFGDGTSANNLNQTVTHTYANSGVYYPILVVTYGTLGSPTYCLDSSTLGQLPINCSTAVCNAAFQAITNGLSATFQNFSTPIQTTNTYAWNFGDGTTSNSPAPVHTYANAGTYAVCLVMTSLNSTGATCTSTFCDSVTVSGTTVCNAAFTSVAATVPNGIQFYSASTGATPTTQFYWSFGDGNTGFGTNPFHTYANAGTYVACLFMIDSFSQQICDSVCQTVVVTSNSNICNAQIAGFYDTAACVATMVNLSVGNTSTTWYWGDGTSTNSNASAVTHNYTSNGTYNVFAVSSFTVNGANCVDTSNIVQVYAYCPIIGTPCAATMTYTANQCQGVFVNTSASGYTNAVWYWGDGTSSTNLNPTVLHTYPSNGVYYPILVVSYTSATGSICVDSVIGQLAISGCNNNCNAAFTASSNNLTTTFTNNSTTSTSSYTSFWDFGDGAISTSQNAVHSYNFPGTYTVCLVIYDSLSQCYDSTCQAVTVTNPAGGCQAYFTAAVTQCAVVLTNASTGGFTTGAWSFGNGQGALLTNSPITANYTSNGVYNVCLAIAAPGTVCLDTFCQNVVIFNCPTGLQDLDWVNNISVTPNPTTSYLQLHVDVQTSMDARVQVLDALGRVVLTDNYQLNFGKNTATLNTAGLANGTYLVRITGAEGGFATTRFIKQ